MSARKLIGLFLIVMGLAQIFQFLSQHARPGRMGDSLFVFVTAFMFTLGAALVCWNGRWWNAQSHTED